MLLIRHFDLEPNIFPGLAYLNFYKYTNDYVFSHIRPEAKSFFLNLAEKRKHLPENFVLKNKIYSELYNPELLACYVDSFDTWQKLMTIIEPIYISVCQFDWDFVAAEPYVNLGACKV